MRRHAWREGPRTARSPLAARAGLQGVQRRDATSKMAEYLQIAPNKLVLRWELGQPATASISLQVRPGSGSGLTARARLDAPRPPSSRAAAPASLAAFDRALPSCLSRCPRRRRRRRRSCLHLALAHRGSLACPQNPTGERIAFKVKTTAPTRYTVRCPSAPPAPAARCPPGPPRLSAAACPHACLCLTSAACCAPDDYASNCQLKPV